MFRPASVSSSGRQKSVSCVFAPEPAGPQEVYDGSISKFGLDIGATSSGVMIWGVFTDTLGGPGFLAGDYSVPAAR